MPIPEAPSPTPILRMRGITKRYPGVVANDDVSIELERGQVHALLGENGAGKSTLMKVLYGMVAPDSGTIEIDGTPVVLRSPSDAMAHGIGMVHQHFMLVPTLTVAENIALGRRGGRLGRVDLDTIRAELRHLSESYGLDVEPDTPVWQLAVGERQRVEILKALSRHARVLILDEPTAVLTPREVDSFFATLRHLTADGLGIILISHKLREVIEFSHTITVLRSGRVAGTTVPEETTREELARMMVGREIATPTSTQQHPAGPVRLRVQGLGVAGDRGTPAVVDVDLDVRSGEILGVAGVSGNGQRELAEAIVGIRRPDSGTVRVDDTDITGDSPIQVRRHGVSYVPEERMRDGAIAEFSVAENLVLVDHARAPYARRGILDQGAIRAHASALVDSYAVKTPSVDTPMRALSGGNIQKAIVAREISSDPKVLVIAQPTRGVDVGASEEIHRRLLGQRDTGAAVLLFSEDLDEVLALSDRVAVMEGGRVLEVLERADASMERLGMLLGGERRAEASEHAAP